jgi:hypothetical protein
VLLDQVVQRISVWFEPDHFWRSYSIDGGCLWEWALVRAFSLGWQLTRWILCDLDAQSLTMPETGDRPQLSYNVTNPRQRLDLWPDRAIKTTSGELTAQDCLTNSSTIAGIGVFERKTCGVNLGKSRDFSINSRHPRCKRWSRNLKRYPVRTELAVFPRGCPENVGLSGHLKPIRSGGEWLAACWVFCRVVLARAERRADAKE